MARKIEVREGASTPFDLTIPDGTPVLHADGFSQFQLGWPNSKIVFHNTDEASVDGAPEQRSCPFQLSLPTVVLVQMCGIVAHSASKARDQVDAAAKATLETFHQLTPKPSPSE